MKHVQQIQFGYTCSCLVVGSSFCYVNETSTSAFNYIVFEIQKRSLRQFDAVPEAGVLVEPHQSRCNASAHVLDARILAKRDHIITTRC
jgi:hypothetical protein